MTTITITLPDDLAKQAEEQGLLSPAAIESYVRDKLQEEWGREKNRKSTPDFFPELMEFHKGRRLEGISMRDLAAEGRR